MPKPRKPRPASVRIASEALSVKISDSVRVAFLKICRVMIRRAGAPNTFADSTKGSALSRMVSARITRKYCGMKTTVMEMPAERMPPRRLDLPPLIAMAVSYTHLRAHETDSYIVCRLLLEKKK